MQLRCKPGELAVISFVPNEETVAFRGLLVEVIRLAESGDFGLSFGSELLGPSWVVSFVAGRRPSYLRHDKNFPSTLGVWPDKWLRPIRDDGSRFDETMFWKCGSPEKHHA